MSEKLSNCAKCPFPSSERICTSPGGKSPAFCPTKNLKNLVPQALEEYSKPEIHEFARQASLQEAAGYGNREKGYAYLKPVKPRIEEIMDFARRMKYTRLGLAFCAGLHQEARIVEEIFTLQDFEVVSVMCKVGSVPKEELDLTDDDKLSIGNYEAMCNPVLQALVLNEEKTHFNVLMGLCVGHDSLFLKYASAPCTILAAKDRLLGHNPLAAVYTSLSYYRSLRQKDEV
ncbi:MAG TPA: DUF1847 domain-containing protein [Synergistaceae bacterium]|nr:DUF1847 domain-containing protein [Synergistaceae bacterium]HPJ26360.1 DUF1847 domain-containing protein [Synergistaceae bacterium]HPQ36645.1 DUF1847 domain-containing protein [Synergistaceae bacterium]